MGIPVLSETIENRSLNVKDFLQPVILNKSPLFRTRTVKVLSLQDILECNKISCKHCLPCETFPGLSLVCSKSYCTTAAPEHNSHN